MCTHMFAICPPVFRYPRHSAVLQGLDHTFGVSPANTNSSAWQPRTPPTRRALPVCEALQLCVCIYVYMNLYIYMYIDMKQVTSMFHSFVTYMLRINPSRQPKTRWFTSLAPASSQLKVWTIPGTHWKEHANFCFQPLVQRAFHLTVTKRKDGI